MLLNYFLVALRNIKKHKGYSFINIAGLSVGMACTILILLWVQDELSYDRFHSNADKIFRVVNYEKFTDGSDLVFTSNPPDLGPLLLKDYPEIKNVVRFTNQRGKVIRYEDNFYNEDGIVFTDPSFFDVFTFNFISGNSQKALDEPNIIILTKRMVEKYFGEDDPIGKVIQIENQFDFVVAGVIENVPSNSHLQFDFIAPFQNLKEFGERTDGWNSFYLRTYVLLNEKSNHKIVSSKIIDVIKDNVDGVYSEATLQPLTDIHLYSIGSIADTGDIKYVYIFTIIAIFILLTACINFMNLATARSAKRAKEVGLRKVIGAVKKQIILQFYGESFILALISLFFSILIIVFFLPYFNELSGKELSFTHGSNNQIFIIIVATTIITALLSGSYPALFLSSFRPVDVLKGVGKLGTKGSLLRKLLVSFQFVLTISLIIGMIVIYRQLDLIRNQKLGYDKENILCINTDRSSGEKINLIKSELKKHSGVINITAVSDLPSSSGPSFTPEWEGKKDNETVLVQILDTDANYAKTLPIQMAEGRFFSDEFSTDTSEARVINETTVKVLGIDSPIGKKFARGKIIGIIKDYHYGSLHSEIKPQCLFYANNYRYLLTRIKTGDISQTIASLEESWKSLLPGTPFNYKFLDENIDRLYESDVRLGKLINSFTILILFVACLGLFGLASFTAEQRTKEIGIRKVLGASIREIIFLLAKEFVKLVIVANLIAWPLAYFLTIKWLEEFAYKIDISLWIFVISGLIALTIVITTVGYQAFKAAIANPVNSLRHE